MFETGKPGSSRRKGDEYQDLTAMRLALESYIEQKPLEMFLEYEKSGNLDDIVLFEGSTIIAYQVKYAVNPLENYEAEAFLDSESPVNLKKFAESWKLLKQRYPEHRITICLCSNRGIDNDLVALINTDGKFTEEFINDRKRGNARKLRSALLLSSGLNADLFIEFLAEFRFVLRQPSLIELEQHIRLALLDKELGLSDNAVFLDIKDAIKRNAIFSRDAITAHSIDNLLERVQSKLLIPQIFPVNQDHFVEQKTLSSQLDKALQNTSGRYLVVTGLPGSGKSTSLTMYFDSLDRSAYEVFRYYCFVGVNDNAQRMRTQAESLRANLLNEFQRRYPKVLKRRFDYSERNFFECLITLAKFFVDHKRHFIIFLDGLDHAERLQAEIRETVISALPSDVPKGVTIVVGTQELHKWPYFLKSARECPDSHIQMPLFSETETKFYLENKRGISGFTNADIIEIYKRSEGLPLYLRYAAEMLIPSKSLTKTIFSLAPALGGDIRKYYEFLWDEIERVGMADVKHLCATISCIRFYIHRDELNKISATTLNRPAFEDAYRCISHLLRNVDDRLTIFHNSFREFVISQMSSDWIKEIRTNICSFLKQNKYDLRWYLHVFKYCFDIDDYKYILDEVNEEFVDRALMHCRPSTEILDAIYLSVESAFKLKDIVQISRLGSLKFRTKERLEDNLNRALLAEALLAMGREQDVIAFSYSSEANHWLVDRPTSLVVMYRLAEIGKHDLGSKLFDVFTEDFRDTQFNGSKDIRVQVFGIARCLAIYGKNQASALKWLSQFNFSPETLEQHDQYVPEYKPHLADYIDTLVKFGLDEKWKQLRCSKTVFSRKTLQYLIIRALAGYNRVDDLRAIISEYIEQEQPSNNVELAFFAAKAGMPVAKVANIAGTIESPKITISDYISPSSPILKQYLYTFIVVAYEGEKGAFDNLVATVGTSQTLWNSALRHLLWAGYSIGKSLRNSDENWYNEAQQSINILIQAKQGEGERIIESIDLIRDVLQYSIGLLTEQIQRHFPERLSEWVINLDSLRSSMLWNTHYGIGEVIHDYTFELLIWETLIEILLAKTLFTPILQNCANTYMKSTLLKGGTRSDHFLRLSTLMAKCGMRIDADKWLQYGICSTQIYGYHKDVTLFYLIDTLNMLNKFQPEFALERCAHILSMVDWMPHLTDGRETNRLPQTAFSAVLKVNHQAAFDLLVHFSRFKGRWQMQDCLEDYILSIEEGDPEYLWCLTELFSNHYNESGHYCGQVLNTRQHIVNLVRKNCSEDLYNEYEKRLQSFILTDISPRNWPIDLKREFGFPIETENTGNSVGTSTKAKSKYKLDRKNVTIEGLQKKCMVSFSEFLITISKLKAQNKHFYERDLVNTSLCHHIMNAKSVDGLIPIKEYIESEGRLQDASVCEVLAKRFMELGDVPNTISCYGLAYACYGNWSRWRENHKYLSAIASLDKQAAKMIALKECYESVCVLNGGYDTPPMAASGLAVLNETDMLQKVFMDFLLHCKRLFSQLPVNDKYLWLEKYKAPSIDENQLILNLVIDELSTSEVDFGERLIKAVTKLAAARPDAISVIINRMQSSSGRIRQRLLVIVYCLAKNCPKQLVSYQHLISQILDKEDFFLRQITMHILDCINEVSPLEESVIGFVYHIKSLYFGTTLNTLFARPSHTTTFFKLFLRKNTHNIFYERLITIEKILRLLPDSLVAAIEERLIAQNWSIEDERDRIKDNWDGNVHPQGWPVVWITTDFQELVTDTLWNILDEVVTKRKISQPQLDQLWQIVQPADPDYIFIGLIPRPQDIKPLIVHDKEVWFNELNMFRSLEFRDARNQTPDEEWITIFDKRKMAQEELFNIPYKQDVSRQGFLIPIQIYNDINKVEDYDLWFESILQNSSMALTVDQAISKISSSKNKTIDDSYDCLPILAQHENPLTFLGYRGIYSLPSFIISDFKLTFDRLNLVREGETVVKYEAWQEGYQDEAYSREILSFGVRLRIKRDFLSEICSYYGKMLCILIHDNRENFESIYDQNPKDSKYAWRYILYHL